MSLLAGGRRNEIWWFWEDSAEQIAPNAQFKNPPTDDGWHDKRKNFSCIYSLSLINLLFYFHISRFNLTDINNGSDDPLIGTHDNCLLALLIHADLTDINHGSDDPLIGIEPFYPRQLTRFYSWPILLSTLCLFKATATEKKHSFSQYIPRQTFSLVFICTYHGDHERTTPNRISWSLWTQHRANDKNNDNHEQTTTSEHDNNDQNQDGTNETYFPNISKHSWHQKRRENCLRERIQSNSSSNMSTLSR